MSSQRRVPQFWSLDKTQERRFQRLEEARGCLASGRYQESIALLVSLEKESSDHEDIPRLLKSAREGQAEQQRQQGIAEARGLLAARRYQDCDTLLAKLREQFPNDQEISELLRAARADQARQEKLKSLAEARELLATKQYERFITLLESLEKEFPDDGDIPRLLKGAREGQAEQQKQQGIAEARGLLAARRYQDCDTLLAKLREQFPNDQQVSELLSVVPEDPEEQRKLKRPTEARNLLVSRRYEEPIALPTVLPKEFPDKLDVPRLGTNPGKEQPEQQEQQKLTKVRALLAAQRLDEAQELLDTLPAPFPGNRVIPKPHALTEHRHDKQTHRELLQRELEGLRKLVRRKEYSDVPSRAETVRAEFAGNLLRPADSAHSQQWYIERETRLRAAIDEVKTCSRARRFADAIRAADTGLSAFPDNTELLYLRGKAESHQDKERKHGLGEQQTSEIKSKINRENAQEAVALAEKTIADTGPHADLRQLLNSTLAELETLKKKRKQERKFHEIRTMIESGNAHQASETLREAVAAEALDEFDPRVSRIAQEIAVAKAPANQPVVPVPPQFAVIPPARTATTVIGSVASQQTFASQPLAIPLPTESLETPSEPTTPAPIPFAPAATVEGIAQDSFQTGDLLQPDEFRKPVAIGALTVGLILAVWVGVHFRLSNKTNASPAGNPSTQTAIRSNEPSLNPADHQQRGVIEASDRPIALGDWKGTLQTRQGTGGRNDSPAGEITSEEVTVHESIGAESLAKTQQQEATLWQQATTEVQNSEFDVAIRDLREIVSHGDGSTRRAEAQNILDNVIPRRQKEEELFRQAAQGTQANDAQDLQGAADLFAQVIALDGPRKTEAVELRSIVESKLSSLKKLEDAKRQIAVLEAAARQNIQQGDFNGARQKADQIANAGGDSTALSREIDQAQSIQSRLAQQQSEFQHAVQAYNALGSRDRTGLEKSGSDFQAILEENGPQATDAQKYLAEINRKLETLIEPSPTGRAAKTGADTTVADEGTIRDVIQKFFHAFEQRNPDSLSQVWRTIPEKTYYGYKASFEQASAIGMQVVNESVKVSPDGTTAAVSAQTQQLYTPKGRKSMRSAQSWSFQLGKRSGVWVIADVQ